MSSAVSTATTPGCAAASEVSIELKVAFASGERTIAANSMPWQVHVVGVLALALDQGRVFLAPDRLADPAVAVGGAHADTSWPAAA